MLPIKKIVVLGPESTGKSTLCEQLSRHYGTKWVPEYARSYLDEHGMKYTYDDLLTIAKGQVALEEKYIQELGKIANTASGARPLTNPSSNLESLLFIDTNMYVMKVWCEFVFGTCHSWILEQIVERTYDLYFLCDIDLEWVKDELREYPDRESRQQLFHIYKDSMMNQHVPWVVINGSYEKRLRTAITAVDQLLAAQ